MNILRNDPYLQSEEKALSRQLANVQLGFYQRSNWDYAPLIQCIICTVNATFENTSNTYFKFNNKWYVISSSLLKRVETEFRNLLADCLIHKDQPGFLPHPWEPNMLNLTLKKMTKSLGLERKQTTTLYNEEVVFVSPDGTVQHSSLEGEICSHPVINHYKKIIKKKLEEDKIDWAQLEKEIGKPHADIVKFQLTQKRKIGEKQKNNKGKEIIVIKNPFLPQKHSYPKEKASSIVRQLQEWERKQRNIMDEAKYNETYLYDKKNAGKPFTSTMQEGWLVGDRICPNGIELFDILHWTKDTLYLYHVKESFGQKTRDACSQILNSCRVLSPTSNEKDRILNLFFDQATKTATAEKDTSLYHDKLRKQLLTLKRKGFLNLFQKNKMVFVYAFVDDRVYDHVITKQGIEKEYYEPRDFSSEKTQSVANNIFTELQKQQYLTKKGKLTAKFSKLRSCKNLKFDDPNLISYQEFVWQILSRDINFFGSLIGRMDLLHARYQVTQAGFSFKICQIQRPYRLKRDEEAIAVLNLEEVDEEIIASLEEESQKAFILYQPEWADSEIEVLVAKKTQADGACAFHALLGEEKDGEYSSGNPQEQRELFVQKLKDTLNDEENGFEDTTLQRLYESNIKSMVEEAQKQDLAPSDPGYHIRRCAKMLFQEGFENQKLQIQEMQKIFEKKVTEKSHLITKIKKHKKDVTLEGLKKDSELFYDSLSQSLPDLETLADSSPTYTKWLPEQLRTFKKIKKQREKAKDNLIIDFNTMTKFLECLLDPTYWLSDDELQMLAHIHNLRVEIMRLDQVSNVYGCNNDFFLPSRAEDSSRPLVKILGRDDHYLRCVPYEG